MAPRGMVVIRGRLVWGYRLPRVTAALTGLLAVLLLTETMTAADIHLYAAALVGTVVAGTLVTAARLWSDDTYELRMAAGGLAGVVLLGQVLISAFGGPGQRDLGWTPTAVAVALAAAAVLALIAVAACVPCRSEGRRHPYAL